MWDEMFSAMNVWRMSYMCDVWIWSDAQMEQVQSSYNIIIVTMIIQLFIYVAIPSPYIMVTSHGTWNNDTFSRGVRPSTNSPNAKPYITIINLSSIVVIAPSLSPWSPHSPINFMCNNSSSSIWSAEEKSIKFCTQCIVLCTLLFFCYSNHFYSFSLCVESSQWCLFLASLAAMSDGLATGCPFRAYYSVSWLPRAHL